MASFGLKRCCSLFPLWFVVSVLVVNDEIKAELVVLVFEISLPSLLLLLLLQLLSDSENKGVSVLEIVISVFLMLLSPSPLPFMDGPEKSVSFLL